MAHIESFYALTHRSVLEHGRIFSEICFKNNIWDRSLSSLWIIRFRPPRIVYFRPRWCALAQSSSALPQKDHLPKKQLSCKLSCFRPGDTLKIGDRTLSPFILIDDRRIRSVALYHLHILLCFGFISEIALGDGPKSGIYFCSARHISPHIGICHLKLSS